MQQWCKYINFIYKRNIVANKVWAQKKVFPIPIKNKKDLLHDCKSLCGSPALLQKPSAFFFHKCDWNKIIRRRADVINGPFGIVMGKHFTDAIGSVTDRIAAILPVEKLDTVMQLLFKTIDNYLYFDILLALQVWNRDSNVTHVYWGFGERVKGKGKRVWGAFPCPLPVTLL